MSAKTPCPAPAREAASAGLTPWTREPMTAAGNESIRPNELGVEPCGARHAWPTGGAAARAAGTNALNEKHLEKWLTVTHRYLCSRDGTAVKDDAAHLGPRASFSWR